MSVPRKVVFMKAPMMGESVPPAPPPNPHVPNSLSTPREEMRSVSGSERGKRWVSKDRRLTGELPNRSVGRYDDGVWLSFSSDDDRIGNVRGRKTSEIGEGEVGSFLRSVLVREEI